MHTITNVSNGRHQVKTLDQGLVFMDPGDELTADLEPTYARIVGRSMSLKVEEAGERPAGLVKASGHTVAPPEGGSSVDDHQNGSGDAIEPTDRAGWAAKAEALKIQVKGNWGINRIKAEIEKAS